MSAPLPVLGDREILQRRGAKNALDIRRPYAYLVEPELSAEGRIEPVATIFLTNRECPFRCTMCDLWKNTLDEPTPVGAIPEQIEFALSELPPAKTIKLYNSGNFFDAKAIPREDWTRIAKLVENFDRVIVENHPKLCGDVCLRFRDLLTGRLEIAMGLETIHPIVLPWLNKRMTLDDFRGAAQFLFEHDIDLRSFVLLRPPSLSDEEGVEWAVRSVEFALQHHVGVCAIVPTRAGNGVMDELERENVFAPPSLTAMEQSLEQSLDLRGRVMIDLWDAQLFARCEACREARIERLQQINLTQSIPSPVRCSLGQACPESQLSAA